MKKVKYLSVKIDIKFADAVLISGGYTRHQTIHNGKIKQGYIREDVYDKRFHAFILDDEIQIHVDKTQNGRHVVMNNYYIKYLQKEGKRLRKIYHSINRNWRPVGRKEKRKFKNQYAPNLYELQKSFKTPVKTSLFDKILSIFI